MERSNSEASVTSELRNYIQQLNAFTDEELSYHLQVTKAEDIVILLEIQDDKCKRSAEILDSLSLENRLKTVRHIIRVKITEIEAKSYRAEMVRDGFTAIPDVQWEDVVGLCDIKKHIKRSIIDRFKNPDLYKFFESFGINQTGILLYGPSGCGKTMLIQALVNEVGHYVNFIHVQGPELLEKTNLERLKAMSDIFTRARMYPPFILFLDDIDFYATAMTEGNILVSLLKCEINNHENKDIVYVFGATSRIELVDSALLSTPRFGLRYSVSLPNVDERKLILEALARKKCVVSSINFSDIANRTACEKSSGADLNNLMNEAEMAATQDKSSIITVEHFEEAMLKVFPSVVKEVVVDVDGD